MPLYLFQHPETEEVKEILLSMNESNKDLYKFHIDETNVTWKRIFTIPNASSNVGGSFDPYSAKDFNRKLDGKNVTVGDMWDASKEASEKRADKEGVDPIKKDYYDNYAKERKGNKHVNQQKEIYTQQMAEVKKEIKKILPT